MSNEIESLIVEFKYWTTRVKDIKLPENPKHSFAAQAKPANSPKLPNDEAITSFKQWIDKVSKITIPVNKPNSHPASFVATGILRNIIRDRARFSLTEDTDVDVDVFIPTNNFLQRLSLLESIPKNISEVPVTEREDLARFWDIITDESVLLNELLIPLETLRSDPNQLIPQLKDIVKQIKTELGEKIPVNTLKNLETTVNEIEITHSSLSIEEVFTAIEAKGSNIEILEAIDKLSPKAQKWLGTLLVYLVQNPNAEIDLWTII